MLPSDALHGIHLNRRIDACVADTLHTKQSKCCIAQHKTIHSPEGLHTTPTISDPRGFGRLTFLAFCGSCPELPAKISGLICLCCPFIEEALYLEYVSWCCWSACRRDTPLPEASEPAPQRWSDSWNLMFCCCGHDAVVSHVCAPHLGHFLPIFLGGEATLRCCCSPGSWQHGSTSCHSRRTSSVFVVVGGDKMKKAGTHFLA